MTVTAVTVRIARKITTDGHPFSEVLYGFVRDGVHRKACSRLWYAIDGHPAQPRQRGASVHPPTIEELTWLSKTYAAKC